MENSNEKEPKKLSPKMYRIRDWFDENITAKRLIPVLVVLLVVYLLNLTWPVWNTAYVLLMRILKPFIIGFGIAYILRPVTLFFEKYKIKPAISVPLTLLGFIFILVLLFSSIIPTLYEDISVLFSTSVDGVQKLFKEYQMWNNGTSEPWVTDIFNQVINVLKGLIDSIPSLPALVSQFVGQFFSILTTALFSFIIGMYFIFDYERVTRGVVNMAHKVSPRLSASIIVINRAVLGYLRTLLFIMTITCVEYGLIYTLVGHPYALVLGVLTALGLLIPYIGPTVVHVFGVLTALTLPMPRVITLTIALMVMSQVDGYLISPMVYSKRDKVDPISSLFVFFAGSVLFGFVGILLSMPTYFAIRAVRDLKRNNWQLEGLN